MPVAECRYFPPKEASSAMKNCQVILATPAPNLYTLNCPEITWLFWLPKHYSVYFWELSAFCKCGNCPWEKMFYLHGSVILFDLLSFFGNTFFPLFTWFLNLFRQIFVHELVNSYKNLVQRRFKKIFVRLKYYFIISY